MSRHLVMAFALCSFLIWPRQSLAAPTACEVLKNLSLPDTTITAAQEIFTGEFAAPGGGRGPRMSDLPVFCRVALTVAPQIHIEVWLPKDTWNGNYRGEGGGGYAGAVSYGGLAE